MFNVTFIDKANFDQIAATMIENVKIKTLEVNPKVLNFLAGIKNINKHKRTLCFVSASIRERSNNNRVCFLSMDKSSWQEYCSILAKNRAEQQIKTPSADTEDARLILIGAKSNNIAAHFKNGRDFIVWKPSKQNNKILNILAHKNWHRSVFVKSFDIKTPVLWGRYAAGEYLAVFA